MSEQYFQPELEGMPEIEPQTARSLGESALQDTVEFPLITDEMLRAYDEDHIIRGEE